MITDFWDNVKMLRRLFFVSFLFYTTLANQQGREQVPVPQNHAAATGKSWTTLSGLKPTVVGRGGFSGLMPEASQDAIQLAQATSVDDLVIMCSLQMTKDGKGLCLTDIRLDNSTTLPAFDPQGKKTYKVNGKDVTTWFSVDYTAKTLAKNVGLTQPIYSRLNYFDGLYPISTVEDTFGSSSRNWLNVQYDAFYREKGIPVEDYVLRVMKKFNVDFLSSPEINFLKKIGGKVNAATTKVIFQLLDPTEVEPTTGQQYGSIVKDLATIKSFASGIMVPEEYIWPIREDKYLGERTTFVADAHKQGLEVYASGFANDFISSYNYSYDPVNEYLQFIDKGDSVDGVVTDFPPSASEAVACFANNNTIVRKAPLALVISNYGASSIYPGCTDLAYQRAIDDGADIIDCPVQMSKDGTAFCMIDADLLTYTTAVSTFMSRTSRVPEIKPGNGIYSFDLTWSEIQSLKPQIVNVFTNFKRNPANKNSGKIISLSEFLDFAKAKAVKGILIEIQNARYLASKKGLDIIGVVSTALSNASFDKNSAQVLIQSDDTAVLSKFKDIPSYKRVLYFKKTMSDAPKPSVNEIKKYADAVNIPRSDVIIVANSLTTGTTDVVKELKDGNLTVFVHVFRNELISVAADYFSDPYVEIATFVQNYKIDGVVTDTPATASRYLRSPCSDLDPHDPSYKIQPAQAASLSSAVKDALPPAKPPAPVLQISDIVDPPLPAVIQTKTDTTPTPAATPPPSGAWTIGVNVALSLMAILISTVLSSGH